MSEKMVVSPDLMPDWLRKYAGIMAEIHSQLARGLETSGQGLNLDNLQTLVEHRDPFTIPSTPASLADWQAFYLAEFGIVLDAASIRVQERRRGFDRLIVVAAGLKIQQVFDKCAECFACWKDTNANLDEVVPTNDRTPTNGSYAIWIRDRVEADEEHRNKSANDLQGRVLGITLLERLILEIKYFRETGNHLDIRNWTLCTGSRFTGGHVPFVSWSPDDRRFGVDFYGPGDAHGFLRVREVVSAEGG